MTTQKDSTRSVGNKAEGLACEFLEKKGYKILERNFTIRGGEIDVVSLLSGTLVFVEVKARFNHQFGRPEESITPWKLKALYHTAEVYINKIRWGEKPFRFDLVTLDFAEDKESPEIKIIENIFY